MTWAKETLLSDLTDKFTSTVCQRILADANGRPLTMVVLVQQRLQEDKLLDTRRNTTHHYPKNINCTEHGQTFNNQQAHIAARPWPQNCCTQYVLHQHQHPQLSLPHPLKCLQAVASGSKLLEPAPNTHASDLTHEKHLHINNNSAPKEHLLLLFTTSP